MLGAAASGIGSAAASAVGTSVGDEVYKYGKEFFHDMSRRVDNDLENNYEMLIEHAEKLYARRDDILAQAKTKQLTQVCEAWISRVMKSEEEIGHLIQLKCLRMSLSNFGMVEFRQNVFSSLSLLEELQIDVDPNNRSWEAIVKVITKEVATLKHLTSLSICFPTVDCLQSFISASPLWKDFRFTFQFSVGYHDSTCYQILDFFEYQIMNCLKFANGEGVDPIISDVLLETDAFELIGHKGASRLSDFGIESINKMRGCLIEGCDEIETIVHCNSEGRSALEWLEKMYINNVPKLESIWEGPIHAGSLARLTTLTLRRCLKLKKIFSNGMIEQLFKLEHLSIEECPEIEEIIIESENNGLKPDALPRLKMVVLSDLPKVKSIWTDDSLKWPSLESIKISMCQMLTRLPFSSENAISLRCIEANQSWWSALVWQDDAIEKRLRSIWLPSSS
ncbi:probable disease resistance protein At4g27220 isoform X2 [Fagus crenata]